MSEAPKHQADPAAAVPWSDLITDALRYWEPRRLFFNGVLGVIVLAAAAMHSISSDAPAVRGAGPFAPLGALLVLAVAANVCYSTAYVVDVFLQASAYRLTWRRWRWVLFGLGLAVAAVLAARWAFYLFP
jgi:hypothetical protein